VELIGEDLPCYSTKINWLVLENYPRHHYPTDKVYFSDSRVRTFLRVLPTRWRRQPAGIDMERNYVTVTLCIAPKQLARCVCERVIAVTVQRAMKTSSGATTTTTASHCCRSVTV